MLKVIAFLKRKPGMTMEEFIDHYETKHVPLGMKYATKIKHYSRRYLYPAAYPFGVKHELDCDVLTELWLDDLKALEENWAALRQPEAFAALSGDEMKVFDTSKNRLAIVDERISDPKLLIANRK